MHSASAPIPIVRTDQDKSFGESAEMLGFAGLPEVEPETKSSQEELSEETLKLFPVTKIHGEKVEASAEIVGGCLYLTNYRIVITENNKGGIASIPVVGVESVEARDACGLQITCKFGRIYKLTVLNSENACEWYKKLSQKTVSSRNLIDVFAWQFAKDAKKDTTWLTFKSDSCDMECSARQEFDRLGYDPEKWRISKANVNFRICETYPQEIIVPKAFSDEELRLGAEARTLSRFPAAVWHCKSKETVLLRSSQPRVGFFSYRYEQDERLIELARLAASPDRTNTLLIMDARSYAAVLGNRAKGGGVELPDYYAQTEVEYMSLPNIHNIRYAFHQLRGVLQNKTDMQYHGALQHTNWFPYLYALINSSFRCVRALEDEGRCVLVHCSDGWDRTTQITSLAKIIADPYYRTIGGFRNLIRRDWLDFGHKFKDRLGVLNRDANEASPVFLQFLDCVYQLYRRNPFAFQFSTLFLTQLTIHAYSGLFGTFLWNSVSERKKYNSGLNDETLSIWSYLNDSDTRFINFMFNPRAVSRLVPLNGLIDLVLWKELYSCSRFEDIVNEPESRSAASIINEGLRVSLHRSHSVESLSNVEASVHTAHSLSFGDRPHVVTTQSQSDKDLASTSHNAHDNITIQSQLEDRFAKLVDISGISKVDDLFEDIRSFVHSTLQEKESHIRFYTKRAQFFEEKVKLLEEELKLLKTADSQFLNVSSGDLDLFNGAPSSGDEEDVENSSLDSSTSGVFVNKAEVADIYDGSKGQLLDTTTKRCMGCARSFWLNRGRHHCRSCGGLFCGSCANFSYHRVRDSKSEWARACRSCYQKMSPEAYDSSSQNTPTQSILVHE